MCQALCPGTETLAFAYPGGDNGLNRAASLSSNQPYTSLANAFKFRKSFDESCACKKSDESWAVVLRKAESMLQQRKGTYCFIGNGDTPMVHHPQFTLNQDILPKGAAYWVALAEGYLR